MNEHGLYVQVVKAFVVLSAEYEARHDREQLVAELQKHVQISTAPYKYPRKVSSVLRFHDVQ